MWRDQIDYQPDWLRPKRAPIPAGVSELATLAVPA
jgi:hypothetical protein